MTPTPNELLENAINYLQSMKDKCEDADFEIRRNLVDDGYENDAHGRPWKKNKWDGNVWLKIHLKVKLPL